MRLIADVGRTNTRMALSHNGAVLRHTVQSFANVNWESFYAIVTEYL